jgi:hypothetical protein
MADTAPSAPIAPATPSAPAAAGAADTRAARAGERVARVIGAVCEAAVAEAGVAGIVVLDDWTPEGELAYEWLVAALGEARVWRAAAVPANVEQGQDALIAHPASRTALLLGGRLPAADLLPLGDVWASQVEMLAGSWSGPAELEALARDAGGIGAVDAALHRLVDERRAAAEAVEGLGADTAARLLEHYERGRYFRLRPRVTPKLSARTLGVDLFD